MQRWCFPGQSSRHCLAACAASFSAAAATIDCGLGVVARVPLAVSIVAGLGRSWLSMGDVVPQSCTVVAAWYFIMCHQDLLVETPGPATDQDPSEESSPEAHRDHKTVSSMQNKLLISSCFSRSS